MIVFDLACTCGYQFEGWFQDHDDFHRQQEESLIQCPVCSSVKVRKIMSAVSVRTGSSQNRSPEVTKEQIADFLVRGVGNYVKENFEDVGSNLAEEALKIHYGVEKARNIRGVATDQEEKMLVKEGVELVKVPLPVDDNGGDGKEN